MAEKLLFLEKTFEIEILTNLRILIFSENENRIFGSSLFLSVCVCLSVRYQHRPENNL